MLFSVRVVGLWFIHTFQRPRIPITADYCPHMLPHVRFPCQEPHPLRAGGACVCWVLPLALGAGCWVLVLVLVLVLVQVLVLVLVAGCIPHTV